MSFKPSSQSFSSSINIVSIGSDDAKLTLGGSSVFPFYSFDGDTGNRPAVGVEITDSGYENEVAGIADYYAGAASLVDAALLAQNMPGADFVCLTLLSADPNGRNRSTDECAADALAVATALTKPLVIAGCGNIEKDAALFEKIASMLNGQNVLFLSAREEDYKSVGAAVGLAYGQVVGAESAVDINLAKQLNVLLTQLGVNQDRIVMNLGSAAAGYGFEYVASTIERVKAAALGQADAMLAMPVITPVSQEAWSVKESLVEESDMPEWGPREARGVAMEIATASACLACGSDAVILRHHDAVKTIAALIGGLL